MDLKIKLFEHGKVPAFQHDGDACLDCYSAEGFNLLAGTRKLVKLGFALEIPEGYEAVIRPRSGLSKEGIDVAVGTIDSNYRGEISANVINNSGELFLIPYGMRICQLAIRKTEKITFTVTDKLNDTERGSNGFGSSGR